MSKSPTSGPLPGAPSPAGVGHREAAERRAFILPRGLKIQLDGEQMHVAYDGDIEIAVDLGWRFASLRAGGDLRLHLPIVHGDLIATGAVEVSGDIDSDGVIRGREVIIGQQNVRCRVITAEERITIGAANVTAEVILAPEIHIDPGAQGRVTVIESYNSREATKIKGGFSLADYEDMFGNSQDFLAQRGLNALPGPRPRSERPPASPRHEAQWDLTPSPTPDRTVTQVATPRGGPPNRGPFETNDAPASGGIHRPATPPASRADPWAAPAPARGPEEDVEDPMSMSIEDIDAAGRKKRAEDELQVRLTEALERILACYTTGDVPASVQHLRAYVEQRDYAGLRQNMTEVWNGLLSFHQQRGIRPHHQVTHAFNVIHGLVQA
jgi:hypothetical protein